MARRSAAAKTSEIPPLRDPQGFLADIEAKADLVRRGYAAGAEAAPRRLRAKGLLVAGMGFSGMVGDMVLDAAARVLQVPATLVKHHTLPAHVTRRWHALAVSYSGQTEETLAVVRACEARRVPVTAFCTGGPLAQAAGRHVAQPSGHQPRAAFAFTWFSMLGYLQGAGLLEADVPVERAAAAIADVDATCGPGVPASSNPAKQLAFALAGPIPQLYATPDLAAVALHFKGMLNENAKKVAKIDLVPESNHNDLTGWGGDDENRGRFAVLALRQAEEIPEMAQRLGFMESRFRAWGVPWMTHATGPIASFEDHVVEQARAIQTLDYASVYVAALRGQDPADIPEIRALKQRLRGESQA